MFAGWPGRRWERNAGVWALAGVTLILVSVVVYTYLAYRRAATELVLERDQQVAVLSAARLREEILNFADNLEALVRTEEMSGGELRLQLRTLSEAAPRLAVFDGGVVLIDRLGVVQGAWPDRPEIQGQSWSEREYFQAVFTQSQVNVSDAVRDGPDGSPVVALAVPILGPGGQFQGALVGMFRLGEPTLSAFYASIVRLRIGQTGSTYVVDGTGTILFDSSSERVGHYLTSEQLPMISSPSMPGASLTQDDEGSQIIAAHAAVPGTSWTLITEDSWAAVTSRTRRFSSILLLSFVAALALPPITLVLLGRQRRFPSLQSLDPSQDNRLVQALRRELHPKRLPLIPGWKLVLRHKAGREGGRDFFDAAILPDGRLMLTVGRATATGIQGALVLTETRSILRAAAKQMLSPSRSLEQANDLLCSQHANPVEVRCLYILVDPSSGKIEYGNAGQAAPLFCGECVVQNPAPAGPPMGLQPDADYSKSEAVLDASACMVVLSAVMMQALSLAGHAFGADCLPAILKANDRRAELLAEKVFTEFEQFTGRGWDRAEDISVLVLERLPTPVRSSDEP